MAALTVGEENGVTRERFEASLMQMVAMELLGWTLGRDTDGQTWWCDRTGRMIVRADGLRPDLGRLMDGIEALNLRMTLSRLSTGAWLASIEGTRGAGSSTVCRERTVALLGASLGYVGRWSQDYEAALQALYGDPWSGL